MTDSAIWVWKKLKHVAEQLHIVDVDKKTKKKTVSPQSREKRDRLSSLFQWRCQILPAMADRGRRARLQTTATGRDADAVTRQREEEEKGKKKTDILTLEQSHSVGGEADGWSLGH